jgi:hypothetical protein
MSNLFGSREPAPKPKPPAVMPDSESPAVLEEQRRAANDIMMRRGRTSTILSDVSRGSEYSGSKLGSR